MAIFVPVYRPSEGEQTFATRQQKRELKRKRENHPSDSDNDDETFPDPDGRQRPVSLHPVRKTDPYYIAGHDREEPLPHAPFPHAAVQNTRASKKSIEEEFAVLNPPLYAIKQSPEANSASAKRRHIDNLTAVLHTCMQRGDWKRALRAWGLLLRTETHGLRMDLRQHGRWGIGAELLMRRDQSLVPVAGGDSTNTPSRSNEDEQSAYTDDGFRLAREYYERLILQYPHKAQIRQRLVTAVALYPALFTVWIYEVQDRSKRAQRRPSDDRPSSRSSSQHSEGGVSTTSTRAKTAGIRAQELAEALPIAERMDELMLSPPYDTSLPLMRLRAMVGLWLSDLYNPVTRRPSSDDEAGIQSPQNTTYTKQSQQLAEAEKLKAMKMIKKVKDAGGEMSKSVSDLLENDWSEISG